MNAKLLDAAAAVIPSQQMLVNVISRRVKQLARGHRAMVAFAPGMGLADIALTEVIEKKLTFESTLGQNARPEADKVVPFPVAARKKAA